MRSILADTFSRYPVIVMQKSQTVDQLPKDQGRKVVVRWDQAVDFLTEDFLSLDAEQTNMAVDLAMVLSDQGNDCAVEALERAIRKRHGSPDCEFYDLPVGTRSYDISEVEGEIAELIAIAVNSELWMRSPAEVQRLISRSAVIRNSADLLQEIEKRAGAKQVNAFQILATHLQAKARLLKASQVSRNE